MDDVKKIGIRSALVTCSACDANPTAVAKVPIFAARVTTAKGLIQAVLDADQIVIINQTGLAAQKEVTKVKVLAEILFGYDVLDSYASETKDEVLKKKVHFPQSDLEKLAGSELLEVGNNLEGILADVVITNLTPHGYEASDLVDLHDNLVLYDKQLNTPEAEIKLHATQVADRDEKYHNLIVYMKTMLDTAAKPFRKKDAAFFKLYKKCRKLHLQGHRKRKPGDSGAPGEFDKVIPMLKIVPMGFQIAAGKIYLFSNLGNPDLKYWTQATPDAPTTIPAGFKLITGGDEATQSSVDLGFPDKTYLFVANESNTEDGEIGIDEVV